VKDDQNSCSVTPENTNQPKVVCWFKVYSTVLGLIYLAVGGLGVFFLLLDPGQLEMPATQARAMGLVFILLGLILAAVFFLPLVLSPRPWVWVYDLVLICIGMTSACFIPACIPLLIFWVKPQTKAWFGRYGDDHGSKG
jgi:hypothetical protein